MCDPLEPAVARGEPAPVASPYGAPIEHLRDHLERVRLLLGRYMLRHARRFLAADGDPLRPPGSCVGVQELRATLAGALGLPPEVAALDDRRARWDAYIEDRVQATQGARGWLPLLLLQQRVGLSDDELDVLLVLAAPELDPELLRAYTHAWADLSAKRCTVGFVLELLAPNADAREAVRDLLRAEEPLRGLGLVELEVSPRPGLSEPLLARPLRIAERLLDWLRGRRDPGSAGLGPGVRLLQPAGVTPPALVMDPAAVALHARARRVAHGPGRRPRLLLVGPRGSGRTLLVEHALAPTGAPLLVASLEGLLGGATPLERRLRALALEARLQGAEVLVRGLEALEERDDGPLLLGALLDALESHPGAVYLACTRTGTWTRRLPDEFVTCRVPEPDDGARRRLWLQYLPAAASAGLGDELDLIAQRYAVTGGVVRAAARRALDLAALQVPEGAEPPPLRREHLEQALRQQMSDRLARVADLVTRSLAWADFIVPRDVEERLREIAAFARHRKQVFEEWGLGAKFPYGRGLSALFSGPPGTGKTMAATIIASDLNMPLYKVDLSRIVDRYIGETEKNLSRVFEAARDGQGIVLFDEADSLFAKRTDVKSSVDRYANLEVNYLLQQMESFEGVTILTTNFPASIDDAFKRRLRFRISFPFPDQEARVRLWRSMLPPGVPVAPELDLQHLAEDFEMSGGLIKNAVLRAAFMAAERRRPVDAELLAESADLEFAEMGRLGRRSG